MTETFQQFPLSPGVTLHVLPTEKFKTTSIYVYLHLPLRRETVTWNALLPMVLVRGTASHPTTPDLVRHLDDLYGASLSYDVARRGEVQSLLFRLDLPSEAYLTGAEGLLERGIATLAEVLFRPAMEGDGAGLKADFVRQEKKNLRERIEGLINDKRRYALSRCREIMCAGESYALYHLGKVEDLDGIDPEGLADHWRRVLAEAAVDLFVVGQVDPEAVHRLIARHFDFPGGRDRTLPATTVVREVRERRTVQEAQPVKQGILVVGFRTGTVAGEPDYFPMLVANGVLGAFPHSKLFMNVREKHSLAYYAYSAVESLKGVGFIYAGIEFADYDRALTIALQQLEDLQQGKITEAEMDATVKALVNDALAVPDSPTRMVEEQVAGILGGRVYTTEERVAGYQAVTPEQVAAAARKFQIDTIYFLTREEGE
ncbi:MAG: insulinase family protein [Firmicutes bacterium]|nr:insulinase family protein [Bacillota bacterium]